MGSARINQLCEPVRETSYAIHRYHRHEHVEKIYENALVHRLLMRGVQVRQHYPLSGFDEDSTLPCDFYCDRFVETCPVVELKAGRAIANEHGAPLLGCLHPSRVKTGLLINFGAPGLSVKKYLLTEPG
ncbi:MAG: GxxExxY protein [Lacunisphaera sp.]|nr:GxxExxY protein [Lacunisphaera sp.]